MASTPPSPNGDILPLRNFNMLYQPSPSASPTKTSSSATSPFPDVVNALQQYQNEILGGPAVSLSWKELVVKILNPDGKAQMVLDSVSGFAEPFTIVAVLGQHKSGKTTLLQALSGRLSPYATLEGEILLNGRRQQLTYGTSAYLTSADACAEMLTVRENMYVSAVLKLPPSMSTSSKMDLVDQMILDLGLKQCTSSTVKMISQGERRRLALAMELIKRPRMLYLDDPICGLDSSAALLYMTKVKLLAREGRTVVACFHEVKENIFDLFDYVCVLGNGKTAYFGEICYAAEHFSRSGLYTPAEINPVNYFLHIQSAEFEEIDSSMQLLRDLEKDDGLRGCVPENVEKALVTLYETSEISSRMLAKIDSISSRKGAVLVNLGTHASAATQTLIVMYRAFLSISRDAHHYWARLILSMTAMLVIGTLFFNLVHSIDSIQERASCIFIIFEVLMFIAIGGMPYFYQNTEIFLIEKLGAHYSAFTFVLGSFLASLPFLFLTSLMSTCIVYFLVALQLEYHHFFYFVINIVVGLTVNEALMMAISAVVPSCRAGVVVGSCIQAIFMLVAGYISHPGDIPAPVWTYPLSFLSFHRYGVWGLYQNEFLGLTFHTSTSQMSGWQVIEELYQMRHPRKWKSIAVLSLMALLYHALYCLCIELHEQLSPILNFHKKSIRLRSRTQIGRIRNAFSERFKWQDFVLADTRLWKSTCILFRSLRR